MEPQKIRLYTDRGGSHGKKADLGQPTPPGGAPAPGHRKKPFFTFCLPGRQAVLLRKRELVILTAPVNWVPTMCRHCTRNSAHRGHRHTLPCNPTRRMIPGSSNRQVTATTASVLWGRLGAHWRGLSAICHESSSGDLHEGGAPDRGMKARATHGQIHSDGAPSHTSASPGHFTMTKFYLCSITQTASDATFSSLAPPLCRRTSPGCPHPRWPNTRMRAQAGWQMSCSATTAARLTSSRSNVPK